MTPTTIRKAKKQTPPDLVVRKPWRSREEVEAEKVALAQRKQARAERRVQRAAELERKRKPMIDNAQHGTDHRHRDLDAIADRMTSRLASVKAEKDATSDRRKAEAKTTAKLETAHAAVREGRRPEIDDQDANFGVREIDNPYHDPAKPNTVQPARMKAVTAHRDDPVGRMARCGHLSDDPEETEAMLQAARKWQQLYERSEIGGARGIDPTKDVVDGGRYIEPDSDSRLQAQARLSAAHRTLGMVGEMLCRRVLGEKLELKQIAVINCDSSAYALRMLGHRFRECLKTLAEHFGTMSRPRRVSTIRDDYSTFARIADNPELHRAIHRARSRA